MFDVITFGSATQDIFLELPPKKWLVSDINHKKYFCLPLGDKVLVDEMQYFSGGGGTNVACALASLGFKVAFYGKVGNDASGKVIFEDLKKFGVNSRFCFKDKDLPTAISFVVSCGDDRTILVYKGACHFLFLRDIKLKKIKKTKWFYLAPFYEKTIELFPILINFAKEKNIQVAANPSIDQIEKNNQDFLSNLSKIDVLFLNKEEAAVLTKSPGVCVEDLGKMLQKICSGIIVITQGDKGVTVFDGEDVYRADTYKVAIEDKTGAGDSFAGGFMAGLLKENNIEYAIRLGIINSAKNISQKGAKNGFLNKAELKILPTIDIIKERTY
ncbi:MAG: carbohydrate kinase family protein [Candidatus Pacebacteria bacterium]|nr:carbohydrate kinase family protein [Candidatus Paceibacterota bacterium]